MIYINPTSELTPTIFVPGLRVDVHPVVPDLRVDAHPFSTLRTDVNHNLFPTAKWRMSNFTQSQYWGQNASIPSNQCHFCFCPQPWSWRPTIYLPIPLLSSPVKSSTTLKPRCCLENQFQKKISQYIPQQKNKSSACQNLLVEIEWKHNQSFCISKLHTSCISNRSHTHLPHNISIPSRYPT